MITLRPSAARGHSNIGWLDARFSFSFADYHDPAHMGFGPLRFVLRHRNRLYRSGGCHDRAGTDHRDDDFERAQ